MISVFSNACFLALGLDDHSNYIGLPGNICCLLPLSGQKPLLLGHQPVTTPGHMGMNNCLHDNFSGSIAQLNVKTNGNGTYRINNINYLYLFIGDGHYDLPPDNRNPGQTTNWTVDISGYAVTLTQRKSMHRPDINIFYYQLIKQCWFLSDINTGTRSYQCGSSFHMEENTTGKEINFPDPRPSSRYNRFFSKERLLVSGDHPLTLDAEILKLLDRRFNSSIPYMFEQLIWGDLSQQSCNNVKLLDMNGIAYLGDLMKLKELIFDTIKLLKGKATLKSLAGLFLEVKYAILTFIDDSKQVASIGKKLVNHQFQSCNTTRSFSTFITTDPGSLPGLTWTTQFHQKIYYLQDDVGWIEGIRLALTTGLFPSLSNVWDFVPYSFVIDWFFDLGSLFERVDTNTFISVLPIQAACQSRCDKTAVSCSSLPEMTSRNFFGFIMYQRYRRDIVSSMTPPGWRIDAKKEGFDHWVESAAMLIQKRK